MIKKALLTSCFFIAMQSHTFAQDSGLLTGYTPPPMFEPQLTVPSVESETLSADLPPIPPKKPYIRSTYTVRKSAPVTIVDSKIIPPPKPKKRPNKIKAPESFVKKARLASENKTEPPKTYEGAKEPPPSAIDNKDLAQPTAQDVLAHIEGNYVQPDVPPPVSVPTIIEEKHNVIALGYLPGVVTLPQEIKGNLRTQSLSKTKNANKRIEIHAYASAEDNNQSTARRTSLARALEIRDFLVENDIPPSRINLRPFGNKTRIQPIDRVEIIFTE